MTKGSGTLAARLRRSFTAGSAWPLDCGGLAALTDMGLSDAEIGRHFGVSATEVAARRRCCAESGQAGGSRR